MIARTQNLKTRLARFVRNEKWDATKADSDNQMHDALDLIDDMTACFRSTERTISDLNDALLIYEDGPSTEAERES